MCDCDCFIIYAQAVLLQHFYLTLSEAGSIVVDISEGDVDHGGSSEPPSLSSHVFSLDHHLVVLSLLTVHVTRTQGCSDYTWTEMTQAIVSIMLLIFSFLICFFLSLSNIIKKKTLTAHEESENLLFPIKMFFSR